MTSPPRKRHWREAFDDVQSDLRVQLWQLKSSLDKVDTDRYTRARNTIFPLSVSGCSHAHFSNRAGHKLMECMDAIGVWQHLRQVGSASSSGTTTQTAPQVRQHRRRSRQARHLVFADLCGGPGSFSQALLRSGHRHELCWRGYGLTLANVDGLDWYPSLSRGRFTASYGMDGSGDIFRMANLHAFTSLTAAENVQLVVADGGFHVDFSIANYQEAISSRIMYGQWLLAIKILRRGGCFVLKLFDTFTPFTRAVLYVSTFLFDRVHIVKPMHSRVVNSERYLVCVGYDNTSMPASWTPYLEYVYDSGFTDNEHIPDLMPMEWVTRDETFMADVTDMNQTIGTNQQTALSMILHVLARGTAEADGSAVAQQSEKEDAEDGASTATSDSALA